MALCKRLTNLGQRTYRFSLAHSDFVLIRLDGKQFVSFDKLFPDLRVAVDCGPDHVALIEFFRLENCTMRQCSFKLPSLGSALWRIRRLPRMKDRGRLVDQIQAGL